MKSPIVKRSIVLAGHKTSVSLEDAFWEGLKGIAKARRVTLSDLVGGIDTNREHGNLSSALRLFVLSHYQAQAASLLKDSRPSAIVAHASHWAIHVPMDEVINAIRRAIIDEEEAGEMTSTSTSGQEARTKRLSQAGLLSREATAAVGSAFNTLTETVKEHEPSLEDVVRETLRPMLKSWLDENLPRVVERMVETEIERVTRGR
jgi:predicted DNA-binding ribbon-helix-helix protein